jgi:hypothetical protein
MSRRAPLVLLLLSACAAVPPAAPPTPAPIVELRAAPRPTWPYWQPVELAPPEPKVAVPPGPPFAEDEAAWLAADPTWRGASESILAGVREAGVVTRRTGLRERGVGAFYLERIRRGAPVIVTLDALFAVAHLAFSRTAAEVEARLMRPGLSAILRRLDTRLAAEARGARPDLAEGYRVARTLVAVGLTVAEPSYVVPAELGGVASDEVALVRGHAGRALSPLLGTLVDYSLMAPRGPIDRPDDPRIPCFEAAEWLADAPLSFAGRTEPGGVGMDVGAARGQARAALLLARLFRSGEGDAVVATTFSKVSNVDRFVLGEGEDLSPSDVAELARRARLDLGGGRDIADTAKLDRLRHAVAPRSMRLVPFRISPEGRMFERLGRMPSSRDVTTWLGSLRDGPDNHGSFYASLMEAIASSLRSTDDTTRTPGGERRKEEAALGAWTLARHDALAFAHERPPEGLGGVVSVPLPPPTGRARLVSVEPSPDAVAKLVGAVRQLRVGLTDLGALEPGSPASTVLAEVEGVLIVALEGSAHGARGESAARPALLELPDRIARIEAWLGPAANPVVIDVHSDVTKRNILEEGTGPLEELFTRVRDPASHRLILAVGASIPHVEREEGEGRRLDDATWRSWIEQGLAFAGDGLH